MAFLIAAVDDEPDILHLVSLHLKKAGFEVAGFQDAFGFRKFLAGSRKPDLILLDLMLPDADGMDICKGLKSDDDTRDIPVIMLTAKSMETDKVTGLDTGADDYITKPFSPREMVARVKAVLRRTAGLSQGIIKIGDLIEIDHERFRVTVKGEAVTVTAVEFKILAFLAANKGKVFSRERILDHLWGNEKAVIDRTVDVHIKNLREKLGEGASLIQNVRGVGYRVEE
jgi:two-component system phosphate regulon response regulator PhoB/two-component system alkaline phosphatase synthesis response regulator PhoP